MVGNTSNYGVSARVSLTNKSKSSIDREKISKKAT